MGIIRTILGAGATLIAGYALKKIVGTMQKQAEATRVAREDARDPKEFKRLKQDPATGVYYAED